jgi:tripartite-type tricarboxylate transporter receptor subunit TctC
MTFKQLGPTRRVAAVLVAGGFALVAFPGVSFGADFFEGKQIKLIIGNTPGGGFDTHGRLLAQRMPKHIPGNPSIIPQNMPGAATLKSVQYLTATAPQDGTVIAFFSANLIIKSVTDFDSVKVDFNKLKFLGSATSEVRVCFTWHTTGIKTFEDFMNADQVIMGAASKTANNYASSAILKNVFGAKIKHVLGYPGSAEQYLAMERGELQGACGSWMSIPADMRLQKKVVPFVRHTEATVEGMPEVPYIVDKARTQEQRQILNAVLVTEQVGRPLVLGPNVPEDHLAILRKAFDDTTKDPEYIAAASDLGLEIVGPMSGEKLQALVKNLYETPRDIIAKMGEAVE